MTLFGGPVCVCITAFIPSVLTTASLDRWCNPRLRAQALLTEHAEALWLAYKPLTRPDRALLER